MIMLRSSSTSWGPWAWRVRYRMSTHMSHPSESSEMTSTRTMVRARRLRCASANAQSDVDASRWSWVRVGCVRTSVGSRMAVSAVGAIGVAKCMRSVFSFPIWCIASNHSPILSLACGEMVWMARLHRPLRSSDFQSMLQWSNWRCESLGVEPPKRLGGRVTLLGNPKYQSVLGSTSTVSDNHSREGAGGMSWSTVVWRMEDSAVILSQLVWDTCATSCSQKAASRASFQRVQVRLA